MLFVLVILIIMNYIYANLSNVNVTSTTLYQKYAK